MIFWRIDNNQVMTAMVSLKMNFDEGQIQERLAIFLRDITYQHLRTNASHYNNYMDEHDRTTNVCIEKDCHSIVEYNYYRYQLERPLLHAIANSIACNMVVFHSSQSTQQSPTIIACSLNRDPNQFETIYLVKNEANQHFDELIVSHGFPNISQLINASDTVAARKSVTDTQPNNEHEKKNDLRNKLIRTKDKLITALSRIIDSNNDGQIEDETSNPTITHENDRAKTNLESKLEQIDSSSDQTTRKPNSYSDKEVVQYPRIGNTAALKEQGKTSYQKKMQCEAGEKFELNNNSLKERQFQADLDNTLANLDSYLTVDESNQDRTGDNYVEQFAVNDTSPAIYKTFTMESVNESEEEDDMAVVRIRKGVDTENNWSSGEIFNNPNKTGQVSNNDAVNKRLSKPLTTRMSTNVPSHSGSSTANNPTKERVNQYSVSSNEIAHDVGEEDDIREIKNDPLRTSSMYNLLPDRIVDAVCSLEGKDREQSPFRLKKTCNDRLTLSVETTEDNVQNQQQNAKQCESNDVEKHCAPDRLVISKNEEDGKNGEHVDILKSNLTKLDCQFLDFNDMLPEHQRRASSIAMQETNGCLLAIAKSLAYNCSTNGDFASFVNDRLKLHEIPTTNYTVDRLVRRLHRACIREWRRNKDRYIAYLSNISYDADVDQFQKTGKCSWPLQNAIPLAIANVLNAEIQIITSMANYPVLHVAPEKLVCKNVTLLLTYDQKSGDCGRYDAASFNLNLKDGPTAVSNKLKNKTVTFSDTPEIRTFQRSDAEREEMIEWQMERNRNRRDKYGPQAPRNPRMATSGYNAPQMPYKSMAGNVMVIPVHRNGNGQDMNQHPSAIPFHQLSFLPFGGGISQHVNVPVMNVFPAHMMGNQFG
ncbi:hypothetical protein ACOME3_008906 [Neoechinorhynchus agilis]